MWRENEVVLLASRTGGRLGAFGLPGETREDGRVECREWFPCRDTFSHSHTGNLRRFFFRIGAEMTGRNVSDFMDRIETRLGCKTKSDFGPTSRQNCIWIRPNAFWRRYSMRRSLLTALLRCSLRWTPDPDNFEVALASKAYIQRTRQAFDYFLEGNTVYTGMGGMGWQAAFAGVTDARLPRLLRRPVKAATP